MLLSSQPLQVEIVSQESALINKLTLIIAVIGCLTGLASLIISLMAYRHERPKGKIAISGPHIELAYIAEIQAVFNQILKPLSGEAICFVDLDLGFTILNSSLQYELPITDIILARSAPCFSRIKYITHKDVLAQRNQIGWEKYMISPGKLEYYPTIKKFPVFYNVEKKTVRFLEPKAFPKSVTIKFAHGKARKKYNFKISELEKQILSQLNPEQFLNLQKQEELARHFDSVKHKQQIIEDAKKMVFDADYLTKDMIGNINARIV